MKTLLLDESTMKRLLTMREAIDICDKTFADLALGNTLNPAKVNLNLGDSEPTKLPYKASLNAMPAYISWQDIAGMKWAGGFGAGRREILHRTFRSGNSRRKETRRTGLRRKETRQRNSGRGNTGDQGK